jgi:hypothetical protein
VLGETFTARTAVAMAVIVVAVVLIVSAPASRRTAAGEIASPNRARTARRFAEHAA